VETFTDPRDFVEHPGYAQDRHDALATLEPSAIDRPIADIVVGFTALPYCFTLQSCYGHFICAPEQDQHSLEPVPPSHFGPIRYRIAYMAFCIENSCRGRAFRQALAAIPRIAPSHIQFGSADWFWERWNNSYALQVEPVAYRLQDEVMLEPAEAIRTQAARDVLFRELRAVLAAEQRELERLG
jgi:hypothetical protein